MSCKTTDAAAEMVVLLNANTWTEDFDSEWYYVAPERRPDNVNSLTVDVLPNSIETEASSRNKDTDEFSILISVCKKFENNDQTAARSVSDMAEEIREFVSRKNLPSGAQWVRSQREGFVELQQYEESRIFHSYIRVTYQSRT